MTLSPPVRGPAASRGSRPPLSEADLVRLWEGQRFPPAALVSQQGLALRVVYRGRPGAGPGPDFRDAVIAAGEEELRGDVELHVAASAFRQHGHHRDPAYDNLVLHVVFFGDDGRETCLACGRAVPTLALGPWVARRAEELHRWLARPARWQEPCRTALARLGPAAVATLLEDAGDARFRQKVDAFALAIAGGGRGRRRYCTAACSRGWATAATVTPFGVWPRPSPGRPCAASWRVGGRKSSCLPPRPPCWERAASCRWREALTRTWLRFRSGGGLGSQGWALSCPGS